jgi:hypothetical protein
MRGGKGGFHLFIEIIREEEEKEKGKMKKIGFSVAAKSRRRPRR